jgi:predicted transposase YdaD
MVNRMLDLLSGEQHHAFALIGFTFATFMFHKLKRDRDLE